MTLRIQFKVLDPSHRFSIYADVLTQEGKYPCQPVLESHLKLGWI
ncbi:hypothetical protein IX332_001907 [Porphyromonas levii]|nr:hypothetical protein [Porphyromonas levii]MBR8770681.1 hypothetical protein [Porphyromonas levii]MBR8785698.1 hypothetical protein [Porphyromonas levii]MBR8803633.1 hypothetical protein [Porphyromonas levii]MBR8807733.1 hypothetical protein [Porphyromonas levii]